MTHGDVKGKRILALDYGNARIGVAVCDAMHIVVSTRPIIENQGNVITEVCNRIREERAEVVLVGVPMFHDERTSAMIDRIRQFIEELRTATSVLIVEVDEAFSTRRARQVMLQSGMSKKRRQQKGTKDVVAAAVILQDFLEDLQ